MTKSRAAKARARAMRGGYNNNPRIQRTGGMTGRFARNWVVGSTATDGTGALIASNAPPTWGVPSFAMTGATLAPGQSLSYQPYVILAAVGTGTPGIGRIMIEEIEGCIHITKASGSLNGASEVGVGVGIYVSQQNTQTGVYSVRQPTNMLDAATDEWLYLVSKVMQLTPYNALVSLTPPATSQDNPSFELSLSERVALSGGFALHVTVQNDAQSSGSITVNPYFRVRVGQPG